MKGNPYWTFLPTKNFIAFLSALECLPEISCCLPSLDLADLPSRSLSVSILLTAWDLLSMPAKYISCYLPSTPGETAHQESIGTLTSSPTLYALDPAIELPTYKSTYICYYGTKILWWVFHLPFNSNSYKLSSHIASPQNQNLNPQNWSYQS